MQRSNDDLPAPLEPASATCSPAKTSRSTPWSASTVRPSMLWSTNRLCSPRTRRTGSGASDRAPARERPDTACVAEERKERSLMSVVIDRSRSRRGDEPLAVRVVGVLEELVGEAVLHDAPVMHHDAATRE